MKQISFHSIGHLLPQAGGNNFKMNETVFVDVKGSTIQLFNRWTLLSQVVCQFFILFHIYSLKLKSLNACFNIFLQVIINQFPVIWPVPVGAILESIYLSNDYVIGQFASNFIGIWNLKGELLDTVVFILSMGYRINVTIMKQENKIYNVIFVVWDEESD